MNTGKGERCTMAMIDDAINYILGLGSEHYKMLFAQLSEKQRNILLVIVSEGKVKEISGGKFVQNYRFASVSSVVSAVKGYTA